MLKRFAIVEDLFSRYTVVHCLDTQLTSVYCDRCDEWVFEEHDTRDLDSLDLFEKIVDEHRKI